MIILHLNHASSKKSTSFKVLFSVQLWTCNFAFYHCFLYYSFYAPMMQVILYKTFGNMFLITHVYLARLLSMNTCFLTENFLTFSNQLLYVRDQITGHASHSSTVVMVHTRGRLAMHKPAGISPCLLERLQICCVVNDTGLLPLHVPKWSQCIHVLVVHLLYHLNGDRLFICLLMTLLVSQNICSEMSRWLASHELERIWKKALWHLLVGNEENCRSGSIKVVSAAIEIQAMQLLNTSHKCYSIVWEIAVYKNIVCVITEHEHIHVCRNYEELYMIG